MADSEPSYIDYEAFLDPSFSPVSFANTLVTATNNPSDTPLDLSTPLSRVLFDVQEIDTHIHTLSTKAALPLLTHTAARTAASQRILHHVSTQIATLTENYQRLDEEVIQRHSAAAEVRLAADRLWQTVKIGRAVSRCLQLGRQLEAQMAEFRSAPPATRKDDHRAMVRAAGTLHSLHRLFAAAGPGEEGEHLSRVAVVATLQAELLTPAEQRLVATAQQTVREFSMSSLAPAAAPPTTATPVPTTAAAPATYAQTEETKARTTSACVALCFLSPPPRAGRADFQPALLLAALQTYLQTALTASLAALARALGTLPTLPRTLLEVAARCQNIVALEALLESVKPPPALLVPLPRESESSSSTPASATATLLQPLLAALDTASLPSFFWRSLASGLAGRVQEIVNRGGVSARTLRSQRDRVRESIRECVVRGSRGAKGGQGGWEREVGVMVGSVLGPLGR
ncbi:hypothetical protein MMC18_005287 [Xylographa bjoerkii]|nr:hypothetical protein [Xylographa bjoerkii]